MSGTHRRCAGKRGSRHERAADSTVASNSRRLLRLCWLLAASGNDPAQRDERRVHVQLCLGHPARLEVIHQLLRVHALHRHVLRTQHVHALHPHHLGSVRGRLAASCGVKRNAVRGILRATHHQRADSRSSRQNRASDFRAASKSGGRESRGAQRLWVTSGKRERREATHAPLRTAAPGRKRRGLDGRGSLTGVGARLLEWKGAW